MDRGELRAVQQPLKKQYRGDPSAAVITLRAGGAVDDQAVTCQVDTGQALATAGLHPAAGGDGTTVCSGDMLLQALVACAGVTLRAVATAMELSLTGGRLHAEGDLDLRGSLGVDRDAPVGFRDIRLSVQLDGDLTDEQADELLRRTERYCVVLQTLRDGPALSLRLERDNGG